jgi:hypothetical protein
VIVFVRKFRLIFLYRLDELRGHPVTFRIHVQFDELQILIDSFAVVAANSILWLQNAGISDHFFERERQRRFRKSSSFDVFFSKNFCQVCSRLGLELCLTFDGLLSSRVCLK